jgi:hypothetical protein
MAAQNAQQDWHTGTFNPLSSFVPSLSKKTVFLPCFLREKPRHVAPNYASADTAHDSWPLLQ